MNAVFDGVDARTLAALCGVEAVHLFEEVPSTMDVAHQLAAAGAVAGTLVVADRQSSGRGRGTNSWATYPGASLALTLIERPADREALGVLSLRVGMAIARGLGPFLDSDATALVKWPNDIFVRSAAGTCGKVAGVLIETRWRAQVPEWVAIGVGLNVAQPEQVERAGLATGAARVLVLAALIPAVAGAARTVGGLSLAEREGFNAIHLASRRRVVAPVPGTVQGISATGALEIVQPSGDVVLCHAGSLVFAEE